jgi:hypothetical protein
MTDAVGVILTNQLINLSQGTSGGDKSGKEEVTRVITSLANGTSINIMKAILYKKLPSMLIPHMINIIPKTNIKLLNLSSMVVTVRVFA